MHRYILKKNKHIVQIYVSDIKYVMMQSTNRVDMVKIHMSSIKYALMYPIYYSYIDI